MATVVAVAAGQIAVSPVTAAGTTTNWHDRDLSAETGAPASDALQLGGFSVGNSDSRVYYSDANHHVRELAYYLGGWHQRDLTAEIGAPQAATLSFSFTGFRVGDADSRVYYEDRNFHVQELAYYQGSWHRVDVTAAAGAPAPIDMQAMVAFQLSSSHSRVYYLAGKHVHELSYYQGGWHYRDLTRDTGAPPTLGGEFAAFPLAGTDPRIYYLDDSLNVRELAYYQGGWHPRNVRSAAGGPLAELNRGVTGFAVNGTDARVYYGDSAKHVHELANYQGGWHHRDITAATGAPQAATDGLAGFAVGASESEARVYSLDDTNFHILEFANYGGAWHYRDLTAEAGAEDWGRSDHAVAFHVENGDARVYYTDNAGHVRELAYSPPATDPGPETRTVTLDRQPVGSGPIPYGGRFPALGVVPSGHLQQIRVPQVGFPDLDVLFVTPGHSTAECDDPGAVVRVREGQTIPPDEVFGQSEPAFSTLNPLNFVACVATNGLVPDG